MKKNETKTFTVLKPHGVATWILLNYPDISLEQISAFCGISTLKLLFLKNEIDDGKIYATHNPISMGYVTEENLEQASLDDKVKLKFIKDNTIDSIQKKKKTYVSFLEKKNRLEAALWLINFYKNINIEDVKKLTKVTNIQINKLMTNKKFKEGMNPIDPVKLGLCTKEELENVINVYLSQNNQKK